MKYLLLLFVASSFYFLPVLKVPFYNSHDGEAHVARFAAYYKAYQDGQFPARWAGDLNFRYGSPLFIFYYPLPGTIASGIHALGVSFENSFKIIMAFAFILAPLAFYAWASVLVKKEVAFLGSFLYGFAPYHFLDLYVRGDIAEIVSFVFVPLVFLYIEKSKSGINLKNILFGGVFYALLILSHNAISLMFSPIFLSYAIVRARNRKGVLSGVYVLLVGLFLSSFFWIPALVEGKFVQAAFFIGDMYRLHFPTLQQLVYSQWGFGPDIARYDGLSPQIGPVHIVLAFISGLLIFKKTREHKIISYWFFLFFIVLFLSIRPSDFIWQHVRLLKLFQFPWRFTALSSFIAAILGLYVLDNISNKKVLSIVVILLFITSIPFLKTKEIPAKNDTFYFAYKGNTDYHGEASATIWSTGDPGKYAKNQIEVIAGNAIVKNLVKKSNLHEFTVDAISDATIIDNTIYFPGWQAKVDYKKVPIEFQDIRHRGLITFSVPQGIHKIEVRFKESPIRLFSDILSVLTIVIIAGALLLQKRVNRILAKL